MIFRVYFKDGTRDDVEAKSYAQIVKHFYNFRNSDYQDLAKRHDGAFKIMPKKKFWPAIPEAERRRAKKNKRNLPA